jgi:hypothetical protein
VHTTDELEIVGVFDTRGSLDSITTTIRRDPDPDITLRSGPSDVFDEIYVQQHGGPPAMSSRTNDLAFTDVGAALRREAQKARAQRASRSATPSRRMRRNDPCWCGRASQGQEMPWRLTL